MNKVTFLVSVILATLLCPAQTKAQIGTNPPVDLLGEIASIQTDTVKLLPDKIIFTQRLLWGQNGLMRNFDAFKLSPEEREKELKIRRTMLKIHQALGFVTMGGMVAQGVVGARLYSGKTDLKSLHESIAAAVNITYFTTAGLSLFAPPKLLAERKGYSSIKLHKALAIVHLSGMLTTDILAGMLESHPDLKPYHRAAAYTSFAAFAASMIVIKF